MLHGTYLACLNVKIRKCSLKASYFHQSYNNLYASTFCIPLCTFSYKTTFYEHLVLQHYPIATHTSQTKSSTSSYTSNNLFKNTQLLGLCVGIKHSLIRKKICHFSTFLALNTGASVEYLFHLFA